MSVVFPWSTWAITATLRRRLGSRALLFAALEEEEAAEVAAEKARASGEARGDSK